MTDDDVSFFAPPSTMSLGDSTSVMEEDIGVEAAVGGRRLPRLALEQGTYLVGKQAGCALLVDDPAVSRLHLELKVEAYGISVRDLDSKNGSYYRGARFSQVLVGPGAVVRIGNAELRFVRQRRDDDQRVSDKERFGRLIGRSLPMRTLYAALERIALTDSPVLIEGETGTGKELCAEAIHLASARGKGPLTICDLAGVSRSLIESELFGHKRGAFTGALQDHAGAFERSDGGSLFLDEIGELELDSQPRLLRALESRSVRPVGASKYVSIDTRILAATNRDLLREVEARTFREDLYYRLAVLRVRLPPLRERKEDIPLIIADLLKSSGVTISTAALAVLEEHDWPGNVRELRNVVERGVAMLGPTGGVLEPTSLGVLVDPSRAKMQDAPGDDADFHEAKQRVIDAWERCYLDDLFRRTEGGMDEIARKCGLGRAQLYRLVRKHGIQR